MLSVKITKFELLPEVSEIEMVSKNLVGIEKLLFESFLNWFHPENMWKWKNKLLKFIFCSCRTMSELRGFYLEFTKASPYTKFCII